MKEGNNTDSIETMIRRVKKINKTKGDKQKNQRNWKVVNAENMEENILMDNLGKQRQRNIPLNYSSPCTVQICNYPYLYRVIFIEIFHQSIHPIFK